MKFKRLVAYGCSFTAAEETGDAEYLGIDEDELDKIKEEQPERRHNARYNEVLNNWKKSTNRELFDKAEMDSACHANSWVAIFGKDHNIPCTNRAIPGASLQYIAFKLQEDIYRGKIKDDDLVVVGITSANRMFRLYNQPDPKAGWAILNKVMSTPLVPLASPPIFKENDWVDAGKWLTTFELNEYNIHYNFLQTYMNLLFLGQNYLKNRLIIVPILGAFTYANFTLPDRAKWGFTAEDDDKFEVQVNKEYYDNLLANKTIKEMDQYDIEYHMKRIDFDQYIKFKIPSPYDSFIPYLEGRVNHDFIKLCETMINMASGIILPVPSLSDFKSFLIVNGFKGKKSHGWGHPTKLVHKLYYERVLKQPLLERLECLLK